MEFKSDVKEKVVLALQIMLGVLFIFSGFAKVIDPLGGWYKVDDYLTAFSWDALKTLGFVGSVLLSIAEFTLGVCLLFGVWPWLTSVGVLIFMAFMTPLTLYIAIYNPVTDCGCFGEALKISNWATFWKNIIFSSMGILLFAWHKHSTRETSFKKFFVYSAYTVLFLIGVSVYCYKNLPIIDFRPYYIGANIMEGMAVPEGAPQDVYQTYLIYEKEGQKKEIALYSDPKTYAESDEYKAIKTDSTWQCVDSRSELIEKGFEPPIHDFVMEDPEDGDLTEEVMTKEGYTFLVISSKVEKADMALAPKVNDVYEFAQANNIDMYMLTATGLEDPAMVDYRNESGAQYKAVNCDEITLKTVVRSNPGLVLIKDGEVVNKWATKNIPDFQSLADETDGNLEEVKEMQKDEPNDALTTAIFFLLFLTGLFLCEYGVNKVIPNKKR